MNLNERCLPCGKEFFFSQVVRRCSSGIDLQFSHHSVFMWRDKWGLLQLCRVSLFMSSGLFLLKVQLSSERLTLNRHAPPHVMLTSLSESWCQIMSRNNLIKAVVWFPKLDLQKTWGEICEKVNTMFACTRIKTTHKTRTEWKRSPTTFEISVYYQALILALTNSLGFLRGSVSDHGLYKGIGLFRKRKK